MYAPNSVEPQPSPSKEICRAYEVVLAQLLVNTDAGVQALTKFMAQTSTDDSGLPSVLLQQIKDNNGKYIPTRLRCVHTF